MNHLRSIFSASALLTCFVLASPALALDEEVIDEEPGGGSSGSGGGLQPCTDYYDYEDGAPESQQPGHVYCATNVPPSVFTDGASDLYAAAPDSYANEASFASLCSTTSQNCTITFVNGKKTVHCVSTTGPAQTPAAWEVGWRKSQVVGNDFFGAGVFLTAVVGAAPAAPGTIKHPAHDDQMYAEASLRAPVTVFGMTKDMVHILAEANAEYGKQASIHGKLVFAGTTYYDQTKSVALSFTGLTYQRSFLNVSTTFTFGPVPVTLSGSVSTKFGIGGSAGPEVSLAGTGITADAVPFAEASASASLAVGIPGVQAGIEGKLTLLKASAPTHGALVIDANRKVSWSLDSDVTLSTLDGALYAYIQGLFNRHRMKLVEWNGFSTTIPLFHLGNCQSVLGT